MSNIVIGAQGAIEQPLKMAGGPNKPDNFLRSWKGPKASILAIVAQVKLLGLEWTYDAGTGGAASLEASFATLDGSGGGSETPTNTWELLPNKHEEDLLRAINPPVSFINAELIKQRLNNPPDDPVVAQSPPPFEGTNAEKTYATAVWYVMIQGVRSKVLFNATLSHKQTVSSNYAVQAATTNVETVLKNATLLANEAIPASFLINLNSAPYTNANPSTYQSYGWFKSPPLLESVYGGKLQITQHWDFGLWANIIYGAAI